MIEHPLETEARELLAMQPELDADLALLKLFERMKPTPEELKAACIRVCQRADRWKRFVSRIQATWN